jgi:methylated-DNA-[protein]-cysteine S-methyltransferase
MKKQLFSEELVTPVGRLCLAAGGRGLVAVVFAGRNDAWLAAFDQMRYGREAERAREHVAAARTQLVEYLEGRRTTFDLTLTPRGTAFQRRVWTELTAVSYGATTNYGAIARRLGRPKGARAVGAANARNPLSIVVPCHRVVGRRGDLTGYAGGLAAKAWLLEHERALVAASDVSPDGWKFAAS